MILKQQKEGHTSVVDPHPFSNLSSMTSNSNADIGWNKIATLIQTKFPQSHFSTLHPKRMDMGQVTLNKSNPVDRKTNLCSTFVEGQEKLLIIIIKIVVW